jgi:hypothetical protein
VISQGLCPGRREWRPRRQREGRRTRLTYPR